MSSLDAEASDSAFRSFSTASIRLTCVVTCSVLYWSLAMIHIKNTFNEDGVHTGRHLPQLQFSDACLQCCRGLLIFVKKLVGGKG